MKVCNAEKEIKLSDFLLDKYQGSLSFGKFCKLLKQKDIKINGKRVSKDCKLFCGDKVECYYDGEALSISVVYQDDNILICNKPQGITSDDYYNIIKESYKTAYYTHRLDRNTSGIIVFALNEQAYSELYNGFKNRTFKKYYYCLVNGAFEKTSGVLKDYMVKDAESGKVKVYSNNVHGSKEIVTAYSQIKNGALSSVLKVELITGRTHQIRAHLAYHGHFVIGDGKYGSEKINKNFKVGKQLLIASELIFKFEKSEKLFYLNEKAFFVDNKRVFEYLK
jgi:23S rRNA pseudouridine955/2504/2580 synthase